MYVFTRAVISVLMAPAPLTPATTGFLNVTFQAPHWVVVPLSVAVVEVTRAAAGTPVGDAVGPAFVGDGEAAEDDGLAVISGVLSAVPSGAVGEGLAGGTAVTGAGAK